MICNVLEFQSCAIFSQQVQRSNDEGNYGLYRILSLRFPSKIYIRVDHSHMPCQGIVP